MVDRFKKNIFKIKKKNIIVFNIQTTFEILGSFLNLYLTHYLQSLFLLIYEAWLKGSPSGQNIAVSRHTSV